jgi:H/ACA ribonucleoprotein complex non-core subunit NAF1
LKWKGSDASWKDDNEVPPKFQDYSDDEKEQKVSKRRTRDRKKKTYQDARDKPTSLGRQPSVKYSKEPSMQHYFAKATDIPLSRPSFYPYSPPGRPTFSHSPLPGMYTLDMNSAM